MKTRHCLLLVLAICGILRAWALCSLPLIVTNDGVWYLRTAAGLYAGERPDIPVVRTPGYPVFLAGVFHLFGSNPIGILAAQHLLGCGICLCVALIACRFAGPGWGLIAGVLCGIDPWAFSYESYVLSETLGTALLMAAVAVALCWRSNRLYVALLLGLLLGAACLVRPAFQVLAPCLILAYALRVRTTMLRGVFALAAAAVGLGIALGPWLHYNSQRGVRGLASGYSGMQWIGLAQCDLLDPTFPIDSEFRAILDSFGGRKPGLYELNGIVHRVDGWGKRAQLLADWNRASISKNRGRYLRECGSALLCQLNYSGIDEITYSVRRLGEDGSNDQYEGDPGPLGLEDFVMSGHGGGLRRALTWWADHRVPGLPQVPLFACAILVCVFALLRREWHMAFAMGGSLLFLASHVATLAPVSRYTVPMILWWYVAPVILAAQLMRLLGRVVRGRSPVCPAPDAAYAAQSVGSVSGDDPGSDSEERL